MFNYQSTSLEGDPEVEFDNSFFIVDKTDVNYTNSSFYNGCIATRPSNSTSTSVDESTSECSSIPDTPYKSKAQFVNTLFPTNEYVESLRPDQIRWFYQEEGDRQWNIFNGYDSLRLECKYRELHQENDSSAESKNEMIIVRGGLYEADIIKRQCSPIYWSAQNQTSSIMRGTWFRNGNSWQPIKEELADQIENEHLMRFEGLCINESPYKDSAASKNRQAVHTLRFSDSHVDWYDLEEVFFYQDSTSLFIRQKLGMQKSGVRLRRGYDLEACMDDKPPDITQICFVIHGIGQKMHTGAIIKSCSDLRQLIIKLKNRYFTNLDSANQRVEFFPVEWRSSLTLDGDTVDSITPPNIRGLRTLLNSSAMDIMYYTSPLYRSEITHGLQSELNRLYSMFCSRHPYFEPSGGSVSIIAHSLGCVITYDIIMGWNPIQLYDEYMQSVLTEQTREMVDTDDVRSQLGAARGRVVELEARLLSLIEKQRLGGPTLPFRIHNFFCLGSPLAVFLALRGVRPNENGTQESIIPKSVCQRIFNIYHPADPVGYRLEPLILKHYSTLHPVVIVRFDQAVKVAYESISASPIVKKETKNGLKKGVEASSSASELRVASKAGTFTCNSPVPFSRLTSRTHSDNNLSRGRTTPGPIVALSNKPEEDDAEDGWEATYSSKNANGAVPQEPQQAEFELAAPSESTFSARFSSLLSRLSKRRGGADEENDNKCVTELRPVESTSLSNNKEQLDLEVTLATLDKELERGCGSSTKPGLDSIYTRQENTQLEYRLDYQLQESRYESTYLSVLTSHTSYWTKEDVAMFVMTHLFPDFGPPDS